MSSIVPEPRHCGRDIDAILPFADGKALAVYDAFERGAHQLVSATRWRFARYGRHAACETVFSIRKPVSGPKLRKYWEIPFSAAETNRQLPPG
jgi:hypothetical protein